MVARRAAEAIVAAAMGRGEEVKTESSGSRPEPAPSSDVDAPAGKLVDKWKLLPVFLKMRGVASTVLESFNFFLETEIEKIVRANSEIRTDVDPHFFLRYKRVQVGTPTVEEGMTLSRITPQLCRLRDLSYCAPIMVDVEFTRGNSIVRRDELVIGRLPLMLRSRNCVLYGKTESELAALGECPLDPGGYFVIKGVEKVLLIQEQISKNKTIVEIDSKGFPVASITSSTYERKSRTALAMKNGCIQLKHNSFTEDIPVCVALRAMGFENDAEICSFVGAEPDILEVFAPSIDEAQRVAGSSAQQALDYLAQRTKSYRRYAKPGARVEEAREALSLVVLAHIPVKDFDYRDKCIFMCHMIRRLVNAVRDPSTVDDKDYAGNKRLELAGQLISILFEDLFKKFNTELRRHAENVLSKANRAAVFDITKCIRQDTITNGLINAIATGNWNVKRFKMDRSGVTQVLSRLSYISALGMMTRITSQFEKTRKVSGPRALQPSQWGMLCPSDTPEGESCGLVKNLALLTHVTTDEDTQQVAGILRNLGVESMTRVDGYAMNAANSYKVIMSGIIIGVTRKPVQIARAVRELRRCGRIGAYVSVFVHQELKTVFVAVDGGRMCRPLIIVDHGKPRVRQQHINEVLEGTRTFRDFLREGLIEFIDVNEENDAFIALNELGIEHDTTHMEIDPMTILGVCAGLIPYPHHNQSPRNTYQCAMGKQAIGSIASNQHTRADSLLYLMVYPQKPMVKTKTIDIINYNELPAGQNAIVAIMSYSGYDIEDAIVLNRASVDRGFGRCMVFRKYAAQIRRYPNQTVDRLHPPPPEFDPETGRRRQDRYDILEEDGLCAVGECIKPNDIYLNKYTPVNTTDAIGNPDLLDDTAYRPTPLSFKGPVPCQVDKVIVTSNEDEHFLVKILIRSTRRPELGDKFSSRHGQKGVVGIIVNEEDLPFTESGVIPDLIMNPHGFPSRMTVGKLMELLGGKAGILEGHQNDGSAFGGDKVSDLSAALIRKGYSYSGKELLVSGITGEALEAYIYFGPVYYQKLKHMVMDKMHARARGPRAVLTRQPTEGRSRDGGLRLGEMERDCLIGYGASMLLQERLMNSSDAFTVYVCEGEKCGLICYEGWCPSCASGLHLTPMKIPYACKLLFQELMSMNVAPRLHLEDA